MPSIVTLTTDFGVTDPYVGAMKGVLLSQAPGLTLVDVCHEVPPHDVVRGAFVLDGAARWFPRGTVHVAVVDPGVGTPRDLLVVEAGGYVFLAPDNGLLTLVLRRWQGALAWRVTSRAFDRPGASSTFHGRDRLAPLAAALVAGRASPSDLGEPAAPILLAGLDAVVTHLEVRGRVMFPDRFGNLVTNVTRSDAVAAFGAEPFVVRLSGHDAGPVCPTYAAGAGRGLFPIWGSEDRLELSVERGSAAAQVAPAEWGDVLLSRQECLVHED